MQKMRFIRTSFSIQLSRNLSHSTTMLSFAVSKRLLPACPINLLRSTFRLCSTFPSANPPDLIEWVRSQGGEVLRNLKIASCPTEGLRIMATGQIPKGAELISLPSRLHLKWNRGPSQGGANAILDRLADRFLSNGSYNCWVMKAGLRLLQERAMGTRSYWWPYISNLPETSTTSIFLYSECMENLQFTSLTQEVNRLKRFLRDFGNQVNTVLKDVSPKDHPFGGKDINSASLRWAYLTAASRAFLCCTLENKGPVFLPLVDMCSHCSKPNATYVEVAHNMSVNLVAEEQIEKDAQVTLDYGSLSNDRFLLDYVFFPRNRYSAQFELTFDMKSLEFVNAIGGDVNPNFPSPASWQKEILSQLNLIGNNANLQVCRIESCSWYFILVDAFAQFRALIATDLV
ncbi:hypothetical protein LUZ60_000223 [Juncus effusus]|nr:hypothetical protein LUZ60_000223 [Juncus effusus]